jgi:hypothetical protein
MFSDRVGRLVLDGMEYVRDGRDPWAWASSSLDNVTAAFEDGFIGECVKAGPSQCPLATQSVVNETHYLELHASLLSRLHALFEILIERPIPGRTPEGPGVVTYELLTSWLYYNLYRAERWKVGADVLSSLEKGDASPALQAINDAFWLYKVDSPRANPTSLELQPLVICVSASD